MDFSHLLRLMKDNTGRIKALAGGVAQEQARWKPDAESWSILEVINHLYDEEREDFRVRLNLILHDPEKEWPPIDPEGWVTARRYNEREIESSLKNFLEERQRSFEWLASLDGADWYATHTSPFGSMRAGDMFVSWVGHDLLHLRQLVELHRAYLKVQASPYGIEYAGPW